MAFHTKTSEAYGNIRRKPNQPCNYLNRGHKSKVNIFGNTRKNVSAKILLGQMKIFSLCQHDDLYLSLEHAEVHNN